MPSQFVKILALILAFAGSAAAQSPQPTAAPNLYLGQEPPGMTPKLFAPGVVSKPEFREYTYVPVPDGVGFVLDWHGDRRYQSGALFTATLEDGGALGAPIPDTVFQQYDDAFLPRVSPDGNRWFFTSASLGAARGIGGPIPMFCMTIADSGWSEPQYIYQAIHASTTLDGTLYYMVEGRDTGRPGFQRLVDNKYGDLQLVEPAELWRFNDAHLVVSPDESYMIFDSDERPRIGACGLFVSFRLEDGTWSQPESLGGQIELPAAMAWISFDGRFIFFKANDEIYWVDARVVDQLRPPRPRP